MQQSRRRFLKSVGLGAVAIPALSSLRLLQNLGVTSAWAANAAPPGGKPACTAADPVASAIGYVEKTKDKKFCNTCALATPIAGTKDWVSCQMLANCSVRAKGSCRSYSKKT